MRKKNMKLVASLSLLLILSSQLSIGASELNFEVVEKPEVVEKESSAKSSKTSNKDDITVEDVAGDTVYLQPIPGTDYRISTNYDNLKPGDREYIQSPDGTIYRAYIKEENLKQGSGEFYLEKDATEKDIKITNDKLTYNNSVIPGAFLFKRIPAKNVKRGKKQDVCIYVGNSGSTKYVDLVNKERAKYGIAPVQYSEDLGEMAMLRAAENVENYVTGKQNPVIAHRSFQYAPLMGSENLATNAGMYNPKLPYNLYYSEKAYLPDDFYPYTGNEEFDYYNYYMFDYPHEVGHYYTMLLENTSLMAQGAAYPDYGCDGTKNGSIVYSNPVGGGMTFDGYHLKSNVWPSVEDIAVANTTK